MPGRISFDFELRAANARERRRPDEEAAMRILVLGDFGASGERKPAMIDVDNFDGVMARIAPRLALPVQGESDLTLDFADIDDFHPDALYRRLPLFEQLRNLRIEPDTQTFARLVGGTPPATAPRQQAGHPYVQALLREAVQPHIVPDAAPHEAVYAAAVDSALGDGMRALLQNPQFKALEALWRGVRWLASNLETNEQLKLYILDAKRTDAAASLEAIAAEPWSLIVGDYAFGDSAEDLALLADLGVRASQAGAPFLAAAKPELIGSAAEGWNALRKSQVAPWIGLALPRVRLRQPYGKSTDPIESFAFEELAPPREQESYLWGNAAFACALLIGRAFTSRGWDMEPGDELEVQETTAEKTLTDRAAEAVLDAGAMPLLGLKNRNAVRVMRFQSIAKPAQALAGPWS